MPRCMRGAVSMKMSRSTRMTSTSGMMLISDRLVPMRALLPVPSVDSSLNAIFRARRRLGGRTRENVEEIHGEAVHLRRPVLHPVDEEVVAHDGGDGRAETGGGGDEGLRDTGGHDREAGRSLLADAVERAHH